MSDEEVIEAIREEILISAPNRDAGMRQGNLFHDPLTDIYQNGKLYLNGYGLKRLENFIPLLKKLTGLRELELRDNELSDLHLLNNLPQLITLHLSNNNLTNISALSGLKSLRTLFAGGNNITDVSPLKNLKALRFLYLYKNKITDITPLQDLVNLIELDIGSNLISDIQSLQKFSNLTMLDLRDNRIEFLPEWVFNFSMEISWEDDYDIQADGLSLVGNPLKSPPFEIIETGKTAISRYFEKIREEGVDYIFEAKLTLVGEGSAGKTSLQKRLLNPKAILPKKDNRTRGIKIHDWIFKKTGVNKQVAHIWDFGGQDVYYPVHRFFLTENSIFVLLASTRQTTHNFDYWIPTIYQFGGQSPIILGQTCHDGNKVPWNDLGYYVSSSNFNIVKTQAIPYYELNLKRRNEGLSKIKQVIIQQITGLPHYGKGVPKSWIPIREKIATQAKTVACIPFEQFKEICKNSNLQSFSSQSDIEDCAKFLHSIGVILWYSENEELKDWVILQPEWAMNAVYKIIDDSNIQKRRGNILSADFKRLWKDSSYQGKHVILKKMLEVFKIAFPKRHKKDDYIIPA